MKIRWFLGVFASLAIAGGGPAATKGTTKIYVTNSRGDDITVIDLASRKAVDDIRVGRDVHGICAHARWPRALGHEPRR